MDTKSIKDRIVVTYAGTGESGRVSAKLLLETPKMEFERGESPSSLTADEFAKGELMKILYSDIAFEIFQIAEDAMDSDCHGSASRLLDLGHRLIQM